ncbi:MAG: bifunctional oligoribonuclease/PAP phosphatase NrnA [Clostridia bacterium]|nr:bifunctional oligoribonuclease/PAP phosphatase NrnA [Clostridia bacterium]
MNATLQEIAQKLKSSKSVAIFTHMRPDGDAYGCSLALSCALSAIGVKNCVCVESDCPSNLAFVEGIERVLKKPAFEAEIYIALDSADEARLGELASVFRAGTKKRITINLDHHISNTRYAEYNYMRECAANCMNVYALISYLGAPMDKMTAEYLLMGLLTDSGNFSHDDVGEEALLIASKLVAAGADIRKLNYELFKKQPRERAALYADVMSKMRFYHDGRFAVIVITQEQMQKHGANYGMTEGFVDFPLNVDTVEVAASLMEMKKGQYKISLRSKTYADVNQVASVYGGGGHIRASGCMLFGALEEVIDRLSYTVSQYLE